MNYAHIHLIFNHFPIVGNMCGLFLLILGYWKKNSEFKKASLWLFVIAAIATLPTFISGDRAADLVEQLPGIAPDFIGLHEDAGHYAAIGLGVLGVLSLIGLWLGRSGREVSKGLMGLVFLASLAVAGLTGYAANLGGEIHHEEIRRNFKLPETTPETGPHATDSD